MSVDVVKKFGFSHKCGVLMPVSSLPSQYGIGSFGKPAFDFVDFLHDCGQSCWQVLPLNPTSYGDSPYQSPSSYAGNPYFIDLELLKKDGLLCDDDLKEATHDTERVDYGWLFENRYNTLRKAFSRFVPTNEYKLFLQRESAWIDDYALFMSIKEKFEFRAWAEWDDEYKYYFKAKQHADEFVSSGEFWKFIQFEFFKQWSKLKSYANERGIQIVGDTPIYVAYDSVEVWCDPSQFLLDRALNPRVVAGCPPDAFAEDGQLWGNPIYDWKKMQKEGFSWWIDRIKHALSMYDILRIDHFRGFAGYYVIPFGETTARNGHWVEGVGKDLFKTVFSHFENARIIAEDLGFITDDVRELLQYTSFPGMKVLQFAFYDEKSEYLPKNYTTDNCVVYTGTHDCDVSKVWYESLDKQTLAIFEKLCPQTESSAVQSLVMLALNSKANLAIIPLQDYLELGDEARINRPSIPFGNWTWRALPTHLSKTNKQHILKCAKQSGRA